MNIELLSEGILEGKRRALARGLTLVESARPEHEKKSLELFDLLGSGTRALRLGVTGPPGAGKSTLIECLLKAWAEEGRVAVLAVDPSSGRTGGSLLGDKTRMGEIASHPNVFIRPSPSGEHLGGLGRRTPLMCALLERAGYRRIIIETVGVGQSEVAARHLVDRLLLVALPGAGDEVQGLKRGLMEEIDVVAVNKADLGQAKATVAMLRSALRVFQRKVSVFSVSALSGEGIDQLLEELNDSESRSSSQGEAHFFDQFIYDSLYRIVTEKSSPWSDLRDRVERGEIDFLGALPELVEHMKEIERRF